MGWKFRWVSSNASDFNFDYQVSITPEEVGKKQVYYNYEMMEFPAEERPGLSVFAKDASGAIFHTYSSYARGLDILVGAYNFLDLVPKGRDEAGLKHSMAWVRHHDKYGEGYFVDPEPALRPAGSRQAESKRFVLPRLRSAIREPAITTAREIPAAAMAPAKAGRGTAKKERSDEGSESQPFVYSRPNSGRGLRCHQQCSRLVVGRN